MSMSATAANSLIKSQGANIFSCLEDHDKDACKRVSKAWNQAATAATVESPHMSDSAVFIKFYGVDLASPTFSWDGLSREVQGQSDRQLTDEVDRPVFVPLPPPPPLPPAFEDETQSAPQIRNETVFDLFMESLWA